MIHLREPSGLHDGPKRGSNVARDREGRKSLRFVIACRPRGSVIQRSISAGRLGAALAALLCAAPACWWHRKPSAEAVAAAPAGEIALQVTNHNFLDVVVYVLHDGQRTRVGTVTGSSSQIFYFPVRLLGQGHEIQLYGDAIGSPDFARTERLTIQPGQYIEWTLESDLRRSSVGVY